MNRQRKNKGFTLIEFILVVVVLGSIAFITAPLIDSAIDSWEFVKYRSELWQNAELAFSRMGSEIREIGGTSDVITAGPQTLQFNTVGGDNITYSLTGTTLSRNGNPLLSGIEAFSFSYFDENLNALPSPIVAPLVTNVRVVRMLIVLGPTGRTFTLQTDVHPRNLD